MKKDINQYDSQKLPHGIWEVYYEDGALCWKDNYLHGKLHGICEEYNPNGTLYSRKSYFHGNFRGLSEYCGPKGVTLYKKYHILVR